MGLVLYLADITDCDVVQLVVHSVDALNPNYFNIFDYLVLKQECLVLFFCSICEEVSPTSLVRADLLLQRQSIRSNYLFFFLFESIDLTNSGYFPQRRLRMGLPMCKPASSLEISGTVSSDSDFPNIQDWISKIYVIL